MRRVVAVHRGVVEPLHAPLGEQQLAELGLVDGAVGPSDVEELVGEAAARRGFELVVCARAATRSPRRW